jgi:hypothetical protein
MSATSEAPSLILGFDLALRCGWCLLENGRVEGCGAFQIKAELEGLVSEIRWQRECRRLEAFSAWLVGWRENYGHRLTAIVYEGLSYKSGGRKGETRKAQDSKARFDNYGALRGVMLLELGDLCPTAFIMPSSAKLHVAGHGRADKDTVRKKINERHHLEIGPKDHDVSDAVAVALTYYAKHVRPSAQIELGAQ